VLPVWLLDWLPNAKLLTFIAFFLALVLFERLIAARPFAGWPRWGGNVGLGAVNAVMAVLLPFGPVIAAAWANAHGIGLAPLVDAPAWLEAAIILLVLDLVIYAQHRAFHQLRWLWPLHRYHHRDAAIDLSTGVRFNPAEILLSLVIKSAAVIALGAPVWLVLLFESLLTVMSLFSHSNIALPGWIDTPLRRVLVTPAYHLVHHGAQGDDMNRNFSSGLAIWDHLFGSYQQHLTSPVLGLRASETRI
jgi:sterol desaturase/sphingolipid hydroxylase (fatty acid hydroxylase superfamily)